MVDCEGERHKRTSFIHVAVNTRTAKGEERMQRVRDGKHRVVCNILCNVLKLDAVLRQVRICPAMMCMGYTHPIHIVPMRHTPT
jgi:hypothetical protein